MARRLPYLLLLTLACSSSHPSPPPTAAPDGGVPPSTSDGGAAPAGNGVACHPPAALDAAPATAPTPSTAARPRPFLTARPHGAAQQWVDKLTEAQWLALVPRQSPRDPSFGGCHPAGTTGYKWDPLDPDHLSYVDAAGN